jgi:hypothetical protein
MGPNGPVGALLVLLLAVPSLALLPNCPFTLFDGR